MREEWAKYALHRYEMLKNWKNYVSIIVRACKEILGNNYLGTYVVGGAAENRLTVLSDIDVIVLTKDPSLKTIDIMIAIKRKAEELGLPIDLPIDLKILTPNEFKQLVEKGVFKKVIEIK